MRGLKGGSKNRTEGFWGLCTDRPEEEERRKTMKPVCQSGLPATIPLC